jgi:hypothetical protein
MATRNAADLTELNSAYAASANGDIINLTGVGNAYNYNSDTEWLSPSGTKTVTFQGQGSAVTKFGFLCIRASNTTWTDLSARTISSTNPFGVQPLVHSSNVVLDTVKIDGEYRTSSPINPESGQAVLQAEPYTGGLLELGGSSWTVRNSDLGRAINCKIIQHTGANTTLENCLIHDCYLNNQGRVNDVPPYGFMHMEAIWTTASGFTVKRCKFYKNAVYDIFFTNLGGSATVGVTLENNVFAHSTGGTSEATAGTWDPNTTGIYINYLAPGASPGVLTNWVVRNNTFETPVVNTSGQTATGSRWKNNVGSWPNIPGMVYGYNVGTKIHATDTLVSPAASTSSTTAPFGWVSPSHPNYDFHLTSSSVCRDKGDPADFPATDLDGNART